MSDFSGKSFQPPPELHPNRPGLERALRLIAYEKAKPLKPDAYAMLEEMERIIRFEIGNGGPTTSGLTD